MTAVTVHGSYACRVCGAALVHEVEFMGERYSAPDNPRKRYCSNACKQSAYRQRTEWKDQRQGFPPGFTTRGRNRARRRFWPPHTCCSAAGCFAKLGRAGAHYCSNACRQRAWRDRRRDTNL